MPRVSAGRLELLGAAFLFSTGGAAIKATALTAWQVACFRSTVAGIAAILLIPAARRNWSWRVFVVGMAYSATMILYVTANKLTTAANTIFLQSSAPLYLLLLGPLLLKEPVRKSDLSLLGVLGVGMSLFFVGDQSPLDTAPDPFSGNVLAALSGLTWALVIAGLRWLEGRGEGKNAGMATVVAGSTITGVVTLPMALPVVGAAGADWLTISYLGVFQIGMAYVLLTRGLGQVPALEASLLLLAEPALNPIWAWIVHGETPNSLAVAGGALILGGTVVAMLRKR
jgi:drug/metabolite transporter (DMT)-like permease